MQLINNDAIISSDEIKKQKEYINLVKEILSEKFQNTAPKAFVHTYGCQGNLSDSERMKGLLFEMGYRFVDNNEEADLILFNTCAIREHAEDRVFGNVGRLKVLKENNKDLIIGLCGCMVQQEHIKDKFKKSYPFVNLLFGTHVFHKLPEYIYRILTTGQKVFDIKDNLNKIAENLPVYRDGSFKAWIPIMYGCDNFCSY